MARLSKKEQAISDFKQKFSGKVESITKIEFREVTEEYEIQFSGCHVDELPEPRMMVDMCNSENVGGIAYPAYDDKSRNHIFRVVVYTH